jgi:hypothetical protein
LDQRDPSLRPLLRPLALLITAQALAGSSMLVLITLSGIIGLSLAPEPWMATLPASASMLGTLVGILPWSWVIQSRGWRPALLGGLALGAAAALLATGALLVQSFGLYTLACLLMGGMAASVQYYVYAGTELVRTVAMRRHVIAAVTTAGIVSAFLGSALLRVFAVVFPQTPFAGGFVGLALIIGLAAGAISLVPLPGRSVGLNQGLLSLVSWRVLAAGPLYGIILSASSFAMMTLLMVGAPIAMNHDGHGAVVAAGAIQWHFVAMYAPALVAGGLINRLGAARTAALGVLFAGVAVWIGQGAHSPAAYTAVLALCGVGWSFMYTSGTTLIVERSGPEHRVRVQGLATLVSACTSMLSSFLAGWLLSTVGYPGLALAALVPLSLGLGALVVGHRMEREVRSAEV